MARFAFALALVLVLAALADARSCKNPNTCRNGGECITPKSGKGFECLCAAGFTGERCEFGESRQSLHRPAIDPNMNLSLPLRSRSTPRKSPGDLVPNCCCSTLSPSDTLHLLLISPLYPATTFSRDSPGLARVWRVQIPHRDEPPA
jgi:hypothetical protein